MKRRTVPGFLVTIIILFSRITFAKSNGTQVYETFPFGDYVTSATLPFLLTKRWEMQNSSNLVYNYTSSEALTLDIEPSLIVNTVTALNSPRTGIIGTTLKQTYLSLIYRTVDGWLLCGATTPATPLINQQWTAVSGVTAVSGIIEVTTTTNGPTAFKHTIVLKKVTLKSGNSTFLLGDNYVYGDLLTTN
jgi:hypothetical protein